MSGELKRLKQGYVAVGPDDIKWAVSRLEAVEKAAREVVAHQFDVESGYTNQSWVPSHKLKALAEVLNNGGQEGE